MAILPDSRGSFPAGGRHGRFPTCPPHGQRERSSPGPCPARRPCPPRPRCPCPGGGEGSTPGTPTSARGGRHRAGLPGGAALGPAWLRAGGRQRPQHRHGPQPPTPERGGTRRAAARPAPTPPAPCRPRPGGGGTGAARRWPARPRRRRPSPTSRRDTPRPGDGRRHRAPPALLTRGSPVTAGPERSRPLRSPRPARAGPPGPPRLWQAVAARGGGGARRGAWPGGAAGPCHWRRGRGFRPGAGPADPGSSSPPRRSSSPRR